MHRAQQMEQRGRAQQAAGMYAAILQREPNNAEAFERFCAIVERAGAYAQIEGAAGRLLDAGVDNAKVRTRAGVAAVQLGKHDAARGHFERALEHEPDTLQARLGIAELFMYEGERDKAAEIVVPLFDSGERHAWLCVLFALMAHRLGRAEEAIEALTVHAEDEDSDAYRRSVAWFRVADLLDKLGRYGEAFRAAERGNALTTGAYEPDRIDQLDRFILGAFTPEFVATMARADPTRPTPIYICGTPRSGSSLVEAILSAHPRISGVGEFDAVEPIFRAVTQVGPIKTTPGFETLTDKAAVDRLSKHLAGAYNQRVGNAEYVVDKWLTNYRNVGVLWSVMPHAKVIFMRRDPRDMALSCLMNDLASAKMATTLGDIAHTFRRFDRYREHWLSVLDGPMLDVSYEELVRDLPRQTERILDFVGVEFDRACLRFYESTQITKTLSVDQVRQPIYGTSVGRWRNYAEQLEPLSPLLGLE